MISWCLILTLCSFVSLSYGGMHNDLSKVMKPGDGVIMSFEDGGDVIDCIDIYKQPAFQHPLLVNHTIQLEPDERPSEPNGYAISEGPFPLMNLSQSCPKGSIPIERTQSNIDRLGGGKKYLRKRPPPFHQQLELDTSGYIHQFAVIKIPGDYRGGKATINVWNPKIETSNDFTRSQIWIVSEDANTQLEAGWTVYAKYYGDYETRLFTHWTTDGFDHTGCYNDECPGFVQTNDKYKLNAVIQPVSVYDGAQSTIIVEIFKDAGTGHWWLYVNDVAMGYWPNELVPELAGGGKQVNFGGEIIHDSMGGDRTISNTEMGSGRLPSDGGFGTSSYFKNVLVSPTASAYVYPDGVVVHKEVTDPDCYDLLIQPLQEPPWGYSFYYGGPGKSDKCLA